MSKPSGERRNQLLDEVLRFNRLFREACQGMNREEAIFFLESQKTSIDAALTVYRQGDASKVVLVGNPGAGFDATAIKEGTDEPFADHETWGNRKLAAIRARRQETGCDYQAALAWVESNLPEFKSEKTC